MQVWWLWAVVSVLVMPVIWMQCRSQKPLRNIAITGLEGLCALAAVNVSGMFTGVSLGINWLTGLTGLVLGLPGVAGLLFLNVLFL